MSNPKRDHPEATPNQVPVAKYHYDAFVSYNRELDAQLARAIRGGLHRFTKPWHRLRATRVFLDDASLSANTGLWPSIEKALSASHYLILLASPQATQSKWVRRELDFWRTRNPTDRLLIVLSAGELCWDEHATDFDWGRTTALPSVLAGAFAAEPRYVDLRWARSSEDLSLGHPGFQNAVADLAATISGHDKDELFGEDVRQRRRTRRLVRVILTILITLTLAVSGLAVVTLRQRNEALAQLRLAQARQVAAEATASLSDRPRSLLLALASLKIVDTVEGQAALLNAVAQSGRMKSVLREDGGAATPLVESVNGTTAAMGLDNTVILWNLPQQREIGRLPPRRGAVLAVALSPDGGTLALSVDEDQVELWDVQSIRLVGTVEANQPAAATMALSFSADGHILATVTEAIGASVELWDIATRQRVAELKRDDSELGIGALAFSPDGRLLAAAGHLLYLWQLSTGRLLAPPTTPVQGEHPFLNSLVFSPDATQMAAGGSDGLVWLWATSRPEIPLRSLTGHRGQVTAVTYTPDGGSILAGGDDRAVLHWTLNKEQPREDEALLGHSSEIAGMGFAGNSGTLVSNSEQGGVILWDMDSPSELAQRMPGHTDLTTSVVVSPDGHSTVSTGSDNKIRLWNLDTGQLSRVFEGSRVNWPEIVRFSPDGRLLAAGGGFSGEVFLLDIATNQRRNMEKAEPEGEFLYGLEFTPDGRTLAGMDITGHVTLWEVSSGRVKRAPVSSGQDYCTKSTIAPNGKLLALACDGGIVEWDMLNDSQHGRLIRDVGSIQSVSFSRTGEFLAGAGKDRQVRIWEAVNGRLVGEPLVGHRTDVESISFSPGKDLLASGDAFGSLAIWDVPTRRQLGMLATGQGKVLDLAYSPNGEVLVSAGYDGSLVKWNLGAGALRRTACKIAHRELTTKEWRQFVGSNLLQQRLCD